MNSDRAVCESTGNQDHAAMSQKTKCKMLVHQLSSVLPDDRPITAISVVEDVDKCPPNFSVVRELVISIRVERFRRKDDNKRT